MPASHPDVPALGRLVPRRSGSLGVALAMAVMIPVALNQGGYFPVAWGFMGVEFAWLGVIGLVLHSELRLSRSELVFVTGALLLAAFTALTTLWSENATTSVRAAEQVLAFAIYATALVIVTQSQSFAAALVKGTWISISLIGTYALLTHLLPGRFGVFVDPIQPGRLFQPLGYWNALGAFCAIGALLALSLANRDVAGWLGRSMAGATLAPLLAAIYFTFSRGAWVALGLGVVVTVGVCPRRIRYLTTASALVLAPAGAVWFAATSPALTSATARPAQIEGPGGRAALAVAVAAAISAGAAVALPAFHRRVAALSSQKWSRAAVLAVSVVVIGGATLASYRPLSRAVSQGYDSFTAPAPVVANGNLANRLFSLSLNDRQYNWRVALDEFRAHPILGGGAGTYGDYWLAHRSVPEYVQNAHSLYFETLAEDGVVGFTFLVLLLGPGLWVAVACREDPNVCLGLGAYVAFLAHMSFDWDWQISAVTLAGLIVSVGIIASAAPLQGAVALGSRARGAAYVGFLCAGVLAAFGLVANHALSAGISALVRKDFATAQSDAKLARSFAPWSDEPNFLDGRIALASGHRSVAAAAFERAVQKEPDDWVAWQWLTRASNGDEHARAVARLKALDPLYDFTNGRP